MATDLPWNGAVRRKAPEEGLSGIVSGISVRTSGPAKALAAPPSGPTSSAVQGAKVEATPIEHKPSGPPSRPNGRIKLPTT